MGFKTWRIFFITRLTAIGGGVISTLDVSHRIRENLTLIVVVDDPGLWTPWRVWTPLQL